MNRLIKSVFLVQLQRHGVLHEKQRYFKIPDICKEFLLNKEILLFHTVIISLMLIVTFMLFYSSFLKKKSKQQNKKLWELEQKKSIGDIFVKVFSSSPIPIVLLKKNNREIFNANPSFCKLIGLNSQEIIQKKIEHIGLLKNPREWFSSSIFDFKNGEAQSFETAISCKNKADKWCRLTTKQIQLMDTEYILLILTDLSFQKKLSDQNEKEKELLNSIVKAKVTQHTAAKFCAFILPKLIEILDLKYGLIRLAYDHDSNLKLVATHNVSPEMKAMIGEDQKLDDPGFISVSVIKNRESLIASNTSEIPDYDTHKKKMGMLKVKSLVSYPLIGINNKLIGIIHFWSDEAVEDLKDNKYLFERLLTLITSGIERTLATEAIKESEERYRHLYETATVGLYRIDIKDGKLVEINDYGARLIGFKNREEVKKREIITSDHYGEDEKKTIYKTLKQNGKISDYELVWQHDENSSSYFLTSMILNKPKGYVEGSFFDITDRKLVEEALMYGEERFRNVISSSPYGIHIFELINGEMKLSDSNSSSYSILKNTLNSDIGLDMSNVFPYNMNKTLKKMTNQVEKTGKPWNGEIKVMVKSNRKETSQRILEFSIFKAAKDNIVAMFSDITERRILELERAKMRKSLEEKNSELEQLLFVTSHDLRSPLVNILGFSGELEEDLLDLARKVDDASNLNTLKENIEELIGTRLFESSQFIQKSAKKIDQLLKGLLRLSRIGRLPVNHELINTNQLLKDILDTMRYQIQSEKIEVEIEKLPNCIGDRSQLSQAFSNLIDNAIKYMKKDQPRKIKLYGNLLKNSVEFCLEDNGIGIRQEHQDKVFQIFHRLHPDIGSGYGLGMTIVQRIILKHGGKVWIESDEDVGTKIYIRLPFDEGVLGEKV